MIRNKWYAVLESREVKKGKLFGVTRFSERLLFWRNTGGRLVCFRDKCAHRGASLAIGRHCGDSVACPFHGFRYDTSGRIVLVPANGKSSPLPDNIRLETCPVREYLGMIYVFWCSPDADKSDTNLPPLPVFDDIDDTFSCVTTQHHWPVHYSRAVENQLDLVHLPFVHYNTIGRGNRTLVNGPVEQKDTNEIRFWVYNEKDTGQIPRIADELPPPDRNRQHIHFIFPNIWENWIISKLRIFVAFVPVDENNTVIYLRTMQKMIKLPLLRQLFDAINMYFSVKVLNQDRRVVITQEPVKTGLKMDEKLIRGDLPIITYRRMRDEFMKNQS